jgi:hypothetical protein
MGEAEKPADRPGDPLPFLGLSRQLIPASLRGIELRSAIVPRTSPLKSDRALLLKAQERGIHRAFVQSQNGFAHLLDSSRDSISVERPQSLERLKNHEIESPLEDIRLLPAGPDFLGHFHRKSTTPIVGISIGGRSTERLHWGTGRAT